MNDARPRSFPMTDLGNAERLIARHGADLRYVTGLDTWLVWDGRRWTPDGGRLEQLAKSTVRSIADELPHAPSHHDAAALLRHAMVSESRRGLGAMIELAKSEPGVTVAVAALNRDDWLLNVENGTVDLRTGELREHRRSDLISKLAPVVFDPLATSPLWTRFLQQVTGGDDNLASYLQRAVGYSLTGSTSEEALFFVHGPPASGKTTFVESIKTTLGEYARTADFESFLHRRTGGVRNDIARLAGARFVSGSEVNRGERIAEGLVKQLTGGDAVTSRFLYKEAFEFRPTFKLFLVANDRPRVDHDDDAMWRRIRQVPFAHTVPVEDRTARMKETLCDTAVSGSAILAWAVRGCQEWQRCGLGLPASIEAATTAFRHEMDVLGQFIEDACVQDATAWVARAALYCAFARWAQQGGTPIPIRRRDFYTQLEGRGYARTKMSGTEAFRGLRLNAA